MIELKAIQLDKNGKQGFRLIKTKNIKIIKNEIENIIKNINENDTVLKYTQPIKKLDDGINYYARLKISKTTLNDFIYNEKTLHHTWHKTSLAEAKDILKKHFKDLNEFSKEEIYQGECKNRAENTIKISIFPFIYLNVIVDDEKITLNYEHEGTVILSRNYHLTEENIAKKILSETTLLQLNNKSEHEKAAILKHLYSDPRFPEDVQAIEDTIEKTKHLFYQKQKIKSITKKMTYFFQNPKP